MDGLLDTIQKQVANKNGHVPKFDGKDNVYKKKHAARHGLCPICGIEKTHKRVMRGFRYTWEPLTITDSHTGAITVYKGHCIQPTCYPSVEHVKLLLGEVQDRVRFRHEPVDADRGSAPAIVFDKNPAAIDSGTKSADAIHTNQIETRKPQILANYVQERNWQRVAESLHEFPHLTQHEISKHEFHILWGEAPLKIIRSLIKAWPIAYEGVDQLGLNLIKTKCFKREWTTLKIIIEEYPEAVTAEDVEYVIRDREPPVDVFGLMLNRQPDAPLKIPQIIFDLIAKEKLVHFQALLKRCPDAVKVRDTNLHLTPLLMMFQKKSTIQIDWIFSILIFNLGAAKKRDFDGKTPLHLAREHDAPMEVVDVLFQAYPDAVHVRDNLGRTPSDLARKNRSAKQMFTKCDDASILVEGDVVYAHGRFDLNRNPYPKNAVVLRRSDMLMRDIPLGEDKDNSLQSNYGKQVLTRHTIFGTLLDEFAKKIGISDKDVIQKAATVQALAAKYLSHQNDTVINFDLFDNPGYWYQQEVLKLVMRVYHEGQSDAIVNSSVLDDADVCLQHLERSQHGTGRRPPKPSDEHIKAFEDVMAYIKEGLDRGLHLYRFQGPVLKPLQSLFNKLFIRRGQTSVNVIGDLVRGTLYVNDKKTLRYITKKIKESFPDITENQFQHPDTFDGLVDFLTYVHENLKYLSKSNVLPYRFKANSSQRKKELKADEEEPLWFNFNFFLQIPEYYRIGQTEIFVACELQIGLTSEIVKHRQSHDAYERDRILSSQPLLKNYNNYYIVDNKKKGFSQPFMKKNNENDESKRSRSRSSCSFMDNKLIENVLYGRVGSEVLVPSSSCAGRDKTNNSDSSSVNSTNTLSFESGPFSLSNDDHKQQPRQQPHHGVVVIDEKLLVKRNQVCINNRNFNRYVSEGTNIYNKHRLVIGGPYKLDETKQKRYFVDSLILTGVAGSTTVTVGLYARVGPCYLIQVASNTTTSSAVSCPATDRKTNHKNDDESRSNDDIVVVDSGKNYTFLEQVCPIPLGTTSIEVIAYGYFNSRVGFSFQNMKLSILEFDIQ